MEAITPQYLNSEYGVSQLSKDYGLGNEQVQFLKDSYKYAQLDKLTVLEMYKDFWILNKNKTFNTIMKMEKVKKYVASSKRPER